MTPVRSDSAFSEVPTPTAESRSKNISNPVRTSVIPNGPAAVASLAGKVSVVPNTRAIVSPACFGFVPIKKDQPDELVEPVASKRTIHDYDPAEFMRLIRARSERV